MMHSSLPSEELAAFVAAHPFRGVPEEVLREGRRRILDTLGVALGARRTRPVEILLSVTRDLGGTPQAGVPGLDLRSSVPSAARLLGVMSHVLDFDDTHTPTILHPSGPTLAAALPLAERREASGRELLAAFTFGVEAGCRVALALGPAHYDVGWHVTGTAGTVAAAAACSRLLSLDEARTHDALSIAATEAAGQRAQFGAMTKSLHTGNAAANGALAALLAESGYTAGRRGFEGPRGLLNAASAGLEGTSGFMEMMGMRPGRPWAVLAALSEFGGGVLTFLGLLHPLGPLGIIAAMSTATTKAHWDKPIWATEGGAELPVTNTAVATALILNGPGKYSLDRAVGIRLPGWVAPLGLVGILLTVLYHGVGVPAPPDEDEAREELAGEEE